MPFADDDDDIPGGVRDPDLSQGRAGAILRCDARHLRARTDSGRELNLSLLGLTVELGGHNGRMLLCRHPQQPGRMIYSEDRRLIACLRDHAAEDLDEQLQALARDAARRRFWMRGGLLALLVTAGLLVWALIAGLSNAIALVPTAVDRQVGEYAFEAMGASQLGGPLVDEPELVTPLQTIVDRLAAAAPEQGFTYRIHLVDAATINAFCLPGGVMVIYSGLLDQAEDQHAVAAVLGHEMAHAIHRHGMQRLLQTAGITAGVALIFGDVTAVQALVLQVLTAATINSYSRAQEREADHSGLELTHAAGYDPAGMLRLFRLLATAHEGRSAAVPSWMSTHPDTADRIAATEAALRHLSGQAAVAPAIDWPAYRALLAEHCASIQSEAQN